MMSFLVKYNLLYFIYAGTSSFIVYEFLYAFLDYTQNPNIANLILALLKQIVSVSISKSFASFVWVLLLFIIRMILII